MRTGIVLMTALPPTEGHLALCRFASKHAESVGGRVLVLMCVLPDEPPGRGEHRDALAEALSDCKNLRVEVQFSNDPQGPKGPDDDEFWAHWANVIIRQHGGRLDYVYSSESYGQRLSEALGAEHVPYLQDRSVTAVRATHVRKNLVFEFPNIIKPLRDRLRRRVVLFGQESTGKTTLAKHLAAVTHSVYACEWARPYLESLPSPETTPERMTMIAAGQRAHEAAAARHAEDKGCPFLILDTDLLSTIGYDRFLTREDHRDVSWVMRLNRMQEWFVPGDLYLLCAPDIPVEKDPLRYGGGERDTSMRYWRELLVENGLEFTEISGELSQRSVSAYEAIVKCLEDRAGFADYSRS